jgi:hypothetical protein
LRQRGQEAAWTDLQGEVYGARMSDAEAFPHALDVLRRCRQAGVRVLIISHKTRYPYAGQQYDLHAAALEWLHARHVLHPAGVGLTRDDVFFEATKASKIARIVANRCTHFVDDLPEFLADETFPPSVDRILFDPHTAHRTNPGNPVALATPLWRVAAHWDQVEALVRGVSSPDAR